MYKIGFDNNKYLQMQSERIKERINEFGGKLVKGSVSSATNFILNSAANYLMITTHQGFCRVLNLTASCKCCFSLKSRQK